MYMQRVRNYPQQGKEREMQQLLESWVQTRHALGRKVGLSTQLFDPEGAVFIITVRFNDLAELDQQRQRNRTDQAFQDFQGELGALIRRPTTFELLEVLVPLPS
ncbi:MAG TPA: hypothetical protein VIU62_06695 [Chloroflexota bacterium]